MPSWAKLPLVIRRLAFGAFLLGVVLLGCEWLSPFERPQAGLTDAGFAVAGALWLLDAVLRRRRPRLTPVHAAGALFLAGVAISAAAAGDGSAAENLLIAVELAGIAVLASDFAHDVDGRRWIVRAFALTAGITVVLAAIGLALFYAGQATSLGGESSGYFETSAVPRLSAGFFSAPLLGSFCIVAWTLVTWCPEALPRRVAIALQWAIPLVALLTLSRGALALAALIGVLWLYRRGHRWVAAVASGTAAVAMVVLSLAPQTINPARPGYALDDANPRARAIAGAARTVAEHPIVGIGPGALGAEYQGLGLRAHLTPLNVAATTGLPSALALLVLVWLLWRRRARPTDVVLWAGAGAVALDALAQDAEHFRHVWILLGVLYAAGPGAARDSGDA
jgi:hypothetical protein